MNYKLWITIFINHTYFKEDKCGIELRPTEETMRLLKKANILYRKINNVSWILINTEPENNKTDRASLLFVDNSLVMEFQLKPIFPEMDYFTDWKETKNNEWSMVCKKGKWMNEWFLQIPATTDSLKNRIKINLEIQSKTIGWEFILIPKYTNPNATIELREDYRKLDFSIIEKVPFLEEGNVFRCVTKNNVVMKETYDFKICLWEKKVNGELMLSSSIPFPRPNAISIFQPKEKISSYFYF